MSSRSSGVDITVFWVDMVVSGRAGKCKPVQTRRLLLTRAANAASAFMATSGPCSLSDLPTELLVEIASYYESPFTFLSPLVRQEHVAKRHEKRQILRSLSQSCSHLRRIFLPLLWDRYEVGPKPNFQEMYTKSELATLIFPHIKSVHISMKSWTHAEMETVFLFVGFLRALPNLAGLQIYHGISWDTLPILSYAFAEVSLPTVTALSVPVSLDGILPAFPNVKTFAGPALQPSIRLLAAARKHLPRLEALAGLRIRDLSQNQGGQSLVDGVALDFPHLCALSVSSALPLDPPDLLARLRAFKQLTELELVYQDDPKLLSLDALVSGGRDVLLASRSPDGKVLRVWSHDTSAGPHIVRIERF